MSLTTVTIRPNNTWSWTVGQFYLRDDLSDSPTALGVGNNLFTSTMLFRLNENWGFRGFHMFEARTGTMQEQDYSIYRDLRSWTAALTFRVRKGVAGGSQRLHGRLHLLDQSLAALWPRQRDRRAVVAAGRLEPLALPSGQGDFSDY